MSGQLRRFDQDLKHPEAYSSGHSPPRPVAGNLGLRRFDRGLLAALVAHLDTMSTAGLGEARRQAIAAVIADLESGQA